MIIVSWNCNMAFRKKISYISQFKPDILIIQECENPELLELNRFPYQVKDVLWFGSNNSKGIGIFSFSKYKLKLHEKYNEAFRYVIPISIDGLHNLTLFAVWAMNDKVNPQNAYIRQIWNAINYYEDEIGDNTIIAGDFNSNAIWDGYRRIGNHSDVVRFLKEKNIRSAYHYFFNKNQGQESHPTFYMHRNEAKRYHIDYCFLSGELMNLTTKVIIGEYSDWISVSDHMPLVIELNLDL
ncbi:endonuclease/exonuclease/phosphatase family protein [Paenibacillus paeoniae]|uniref:Endonuclease/exonuclease/phosphatase family protein n=1 Tax=Paenibacillus paeoniae TaxID=2292705 RepID=A0A371PJP3_9BACL|nr:endonuclease/exonuclease/phosphatase family protein [Paenibacillus paeoniae]REK76420.1 endonuclease/exonuclease/phosphatase family protein [Paenibacillus paeoniae]